MHAVKYSLQIMLHSNKKIQKFTILTLNDVVEKIIMQSSVVNYVTLSGIYNGMLKIIFFSTVWEGRTIFPS